jgi:hypothetical protein
MRPLILSLLSISFITLARWFTAESVSPNLSPICLLNIRGLSNFFFSSAFWEFILTCQFFTPSVFVPDCVTVYPWKNDYRMLTESHEIKILFA